MFNISLLTESKLAYNLGTWSTFVMQIMFILSPVLTPATIDPIPMAMATLSSPKRTLREEITS